MHLCSLNRIFAPSFTYKEVMEQRIIISRNLHQELATAISECEHDKLFVLTDENTEKACWPLIKVFLCLRKANLITIKANDINKSLESVSHVWSELQRMGATRHSCLINLGGGMVTDLGGFAASTFKRGIDFINIPTTLLAMVDASVGGKTGINFGGLKNEIGVFNDSKFVILDTHFLKTLDRENILSGYAEMLKHGLISPLHKEGAPSLFEKGAERGLLSFDIEHPDMQELKRMVDESVQVKQRIVLRDPTEQGLRKALNLGHTIGHAFESYALNNPSSWRGQEKEAPILHGYAVAWGLVCELYLSVIKTGFPVDRMRQVVHFIFEHYGRMPITCHDYPTLLQLMTHDKKNIAGQINFTLLGDIGDIRINQTATKQEIEEALDFYREGM